MQVMQSNAESIFHVSTSQSDPETVDSRTEAVELARSMSLDYPGSVVIEREDGKVKMTFREGGLVDYVFETRKGRKAR